MKESTKETTTFKETMTQVGNKMVNTMNVQSPTQKHIPSQAEETYMALMGDAIMGA